VIGQNGDKLVPKDKIGLANEKSLADAVNDAGRRWRKRKRAVDAGNYKICRTD